MLSKNDIQILNMQMYWLQSAILVQISLAVSQYKTQWRKGKSFT